MNLLALDIETTGVDATKTNPVQISMIAVYPGEAGVTQHRRILMNTLCDPGEPIPKDATAVHGITDKDVQGKPDAAIACWQAEHIASLAHPDVLVTYNGRLFDVPIISRLSGGSYLSSLPHIDVLDMAYRYLPTLENHKLGTIYKHLMGRDARNAHNALADVQYTLDIMDALRKQAKLTMKQLLEEMSTPRPYTIMPISKHKGKLLSDIPVSFARWLLNQNEGKPMRADLKLSMEMVVGNA